jgi:hypothetical protein
MTVIGLLLLLIGGQFKPHVNQSYALVVAIMLDVCFLAGLSTMVWGGVRYYKEKNKKY